MKSSKRFMRKIVVLAIAGCVLFNSLSAAKRAETEKEQMKRAIKESETSFAQEKATRKKREEERLKQKNKPAVTFEADEKVTISRHKKTMHGSMVSGKPNAWGFYQVRINGEEVYINPEDISKLPAQAERKKVKGPEQTRHKVGDAVSPKDYETVINNPSQYLANSLIHAAQGKKVFTGGEMVIVDRGTGCFYGKITEVGRPYIIDLGEKLGEKPCGDTNFYKIPSEAPAKSEVSESKDEDR